MFVSAITFSFYPDPDTNMIRVVWSVPPYFYAIPIHISQVYFSHDYIADLHAQGSGTKFKTFKEWNEKGYARLVEDLIGYAQYVDQERNAKADEDLSAADKINFENGPGMLPLIPMEVKGIRGGEVAKHANEVIRSYFSRHYRK